MARIGICGFYNKLNVGDDRMALALARVFYGNDLYVFPHDKPPAPSCINELDFLFIGGGNIIGDNSIIFNGQYPINQIEIPIGFAGLSVAGTLSGNTLHHIHKIASSARFFWVRDRTSAELIGSNHIQVGPDLTWLFPFEPYNIDSRYEIASCFAPCPWKPDFEISEWMAEINKFTHISIPFYQGRDLDYKLAKPFTDSICRFFSESHFRASSIIVGSRLHSIIFAVQMGKPFVAIEYDRKVKSFLLDNDLEEFLLNVDQAAKLSKSVSKINLNKSYYNDKVKNVRQRLVKQSDHLRTEFENKICTRKAFKNKSSGVQK